MKVFTLGYQGQPLEKYVQTLKDHGVGTVIDVRESAWSYNRQYIKSKMSAELSSNAIDYIHLRSCGNPSMNRKTAATPEECLARYRDYLWTNLTCLDELLAAIELADEKGRPACLTCFENDPIDCHRSILIDFLLELNPRLTVSHIKPDVTIKAPKKAIVL